MINLGDKYGKLTVIGEAGSTKQGGRLWECQCDCGNITIVRGNHLTSGNTKSCGCLSSKALLDANAERSDNASYGKESKRLRNIRDSMLKRCYVVSRPDYKYYGERGIAICDEWKNSFHSFYDWSISNGYQDNLTIDRIDNNGNYEPSNCRWVTMAVQSRNKRSRTTKFRRIEK